MRVSREFKLGILVVLSLLLFFIGFNFLKSYGTFGKPREFYARYGESHGLEVGNDVLLHGVKVGEVTGVDLHPKDANTVLVKFEITDEELDIPKETELWLFPEILEKSLELRIPHDSLLKNPDDIYQDGDYFKDEYVLVAMSMEQQFEAQYLPIKKRTDKLIRKVEDIILSVNSFWDTSAAYTVDASMYDVRDAINKYKEMTDNVSRMIQQERIHITDMKANVTEMTSFFADKSGTFVEITECMSDVTSTFNDSVLSQRMDESKISFNQFKNTVNKVFEGEGSAGRLINTPELNDNIDSIKRAWQRLEWHLQERPKDFIDFSVFGLKAQGYKPDKQNKPHLENMLDSLEDGKKVDYK
ncbi:MAG: MCE family protein [Crocinitomicaceae bacterium]|nr:MCE family protein [Crocinitomicaceae bacterium]